MMYLCEMQTVSMVEGNKTVKWEEFVLCSTCADVVEPEFKSYTSGNNICLRCGIKNFTKGDNSNEVKYG